MGVRILAVEDEVDLAELVAVTLRGAGHTVDTVHTGAGALAEIRRAPPDLIVLDLMLPDINGLEVCRHVRRSETLSQLPIVMLTAKGDEVDRVVGFEVGADDYVSKPFSPRELVLRIEAVLRRCRPDAKPPRFIEIDQVEIDVTAHRVSVAGTEVTLTSLEFRLLLDLATRRGHVQSRDGLLQRVWGYASMVETRTVDTHIKRLREKLGSAASVIETVRGVGYRIRAE